MDSPCSDPAAASRPRVLFVDTLGAEALRPIREKVAATGVAIRELAWEDAIPEEALAVSDANVVVIGPGVGNAAKASRRLSRAHPGAHILFIADPERTAELRKALLYAAPANTPWKLIPLDDGDVAGAVMSSLDAVQRGEKFRSTLDRVNLRLATPPAFDAQDYRRLVVSDQYLASVLKHARDAIISLDLQSNILSWNDGASRLFARGAPEVAGARLTSIASWSADPGALLTQAAREGSARGELRFTLAGHETLVDATFTAIEERPGQVIAIAAILRDITEAKRTEAALRANEERFRALADNIPQLAWMTDAEGWIFWYNKRWFDYTGTTLEAMQGWGWRDVHHPEHVARVEEKFRSHIAAGVAWEDTFPLRSGEGEYRWFLSRAFPIRDSEGRITHWFGTNTDITAERDAQRALVEADRRKNEFIGMLSHELRNPLGPIRNAVFILERGANKPALASQAREVIKRQTEHLTRLVDDLLDVTRVVRGKIELRRETCDLAEVVRRMVEDYRSVISANGLSVVAALPEGPVTADIDAARIGQVLGNLLQNAAKFTPKGGEVRVSMEIESGWARIHVSDSGIGIEPELLATLFEPFVQGERSLARSQGGLGLGLALAKGVAELHGGTMAARSTGLNHGATFTLSLPLPVY